MLGTSLPELVFIRTAIYALRLVAPLSIVYLAASLYAGKALIYPWLLPAAAVEAAFYLFVFFPRRIRLQRAATHPPLLSREDRRQLFDKCAGTMSAESTLLWFGKGASRVRRENAVDWLLWALFSCSADDSLEEWEEELDYYVGEVSRFLGYSLDNGKNHQLKTMRLTLDPVVTIHRPFIWYMIVCLVDTLTSISLFYQGFRHYNTHRWFHAFPPRPLLSLLSHRSADPDISYWYRPHKSTTKHPLVFIHGIGIGLWIYLPFFRELIVQDPDVGILALEILPVSMHITDPPLQRDAMCAAVARILDAHGLTRFVVASHSYGTVITAHLLHSATLAPRIAGTLLVDPIPFLLHRADVAYNFVYRAPRRANQWQLWYFASRDPDIARALSRHFFWHQNILFKEDIVGKRVAVVLAGEDQIVDTHAVGEYLTGIVPPAEKWKKDGLEVFFFPKLDHATVFDTKERRKTLLEVVRGLVRAG
ncbi:hypothetical protein DENSPDRAFT_934251 [Dentipellis sp. KUC8613]|nr:hypothetical protein DENSPDRAFT_934251 [Dentipellis sp. KUC8613]